MTTRPADETDERFLDDCFLTGLRDAITAARGDWDIARERRQFREQLQLEHTRIVQCDGNDVGFSMVIPEADAVELHTLCIMPDTQCQGIGSVVTEQIVQSARARNLDVVVSVLRANTRAQAFYERLGFVVVGESEHHRSLRHSAAKVAP